MVSENDLIDAYACENDGSDYREMTRRREEAREFLRELKAHAWERGYRAGYDHADPLSDTSFAPPNPYRGGQ